MKVGKYLLFPSRVGLTFGLNIYDTETNIVNTYGVQLSTVEPYWYPQIRRNTLDSDDGVKTTSSICGWLVIYFVTMKHDRS